MPGLCVCLVRVWCVSVSGPCLVSVSAAAERAAEDPDVAAQAERRLMTSPTDDIVKDGLTDGISGTLVR